MRKTLQVKSKGEICVANFHLEVKIISRGKGRSISNTISYISGLKIRDEYNGRTCYNNRQDVLYCRVFLPEDAPLEFYNLQHLCTQIDRAEKRYDARTAREFIGSLPNELPISKLVHMVREYIGSNFVKRNFCAVAAIHEGRNVTNPAKNNPHVHIIVPTRTVGTNGFSMNKDREYNQRKYVNIWREQWADVENRAYERAGLDVRVSHESLEIQGIREREPTIHLSRIDWEREQRGERTVAGDLKRKIAERNRERILERQAAREHEIEMER